MITTEQIKDAQQQWGDGIVKIAAAHTSGGDFHSKWRMITSRIFMHTA